MNPYKNNLTPPSPPIASECKRGKFDNYRTLGPSDVVEKGDYRRCALINGKVSAVKCSGICIGKKVSDLWDTFGVEAEYLRIIDSAVCCCNCKHWGNLYNDEQGDAVGICARDDGHMRPFAKCGEFEEDDFSDSANTMTRESLVEWAASWVPDDPPGQRARFKDALSDAFRKDGIK